MDLDAAILELAARFKAHRMEKHLVSLRRYYGQRRKRKRSQASSKHPEWDEDLVLQWLALFRIEPFDAVYTVLAAWNKCPCGKEAPGGTSYCVATFPGGNLWRCGACGREWLRLDTPP